MNEFKPDVVVGFGGYTSGSALWAASKMGIPTVIQEQNSYAGITNKMLAKSVDRVCVAYDQAKQYFPSEKIAFTGNPVRSFKEGERLESEARMQLGLQSERSTLVIVGGSLGARSINRAMRSLYNEIAKLQDLQILWQCGSLYIEEYAECETAQLENVKITDFIEDMDAAYAAADVVLCRAGALTLSELMILGKAAILVPSPNVAEDHQTKNAMALVDNDAAILLEDDVLEK